MYLIVITVIVLFYFVQVHTFHIQAKIQKFSVASYAFLKMQI